MAIETVPHASSMHHTPPTPASLEAFEGWLIEQQCGALGAMKAATGDAFTDACAAFALPTAGIDALHAYRYHLARTPSAASTCGRG